MWSLGKLHFGEECATGRWLTNLCKRVVPVRYCLSQKSLIFKIVSTDFMSMGADVGWLSAFPGEAEILYPPLTYLKPTGGTQVGEPLFSKLITATDLRLLSWFTGFGG